MAMRAQRAKRMEKGILGFLQIVARDGASSTEP